MFYARELVLLEEADGLLVELTRLLVLLHLQMAHQYNQRADISELFFLALFLGGAP